VNVIPWLVWDGTLAAPLEGDASYWQLPTPTGEVTDQGYVPEPTPLNAMLEELPDIGVPLRVTDQLAPEGRPPSVKVNVVGLTKSAVIVPGPPIVAVVEESA